MHLKPLLFALLLAGLAASVVTDLRGGRIYDVVTVPMALGALALRAFFEGIGGLETGVLSGLAGGALAAAIFGAFAATGRLGWGDVKLAVAVGAGFGFALGLAALVFIALVGALQAAISLVWQGAVSATVRAWVARLRSRPEGDGPGRQIPYSVAIALGSVWAMWWDGAAF